MPVRIIDGKSYLGILTIPQADLALPVQAEWSYPALKVSPCRQSGSYNSRDMVIAGHNYSSELGKLSSLSQGDTVYFTAVDGKTFTYEVNLVTVIEPEDLDAADGSQWDLTLYTCTYGGSRRVLVGLNQAEGSAAQTAAV